MGKTAHVLDEGRKHQMRVHMEAVSMWDESRRLAKHARVKWVRVHGEVDPMVAGWIAQWGLSRAILKDERGAAVGPTADAGGAAAHAEVRAGWKRATAGTTEVSVAAINGAAVPSSDVDASWTVSGA